MNWYRINYENGTKKNEIIGQIEMDLSEVLNAGNAPEFIKVDPVIYYSRITEKYEPMDKWDSKLTNEAWLKTSKIIEFRKIRADILSHEIKGEGHAFSTDKHMNILVSASLDRDVIARLKAVMEEEVEKLLTERPQASALYTQFEIIEQDLLSKDQYILVQMGKELCRKEVKSDLVSEIVERFLHHFQMFLPGRTSRRG